METLLLGIDIGTSACKTALFRENGSVAASAEVSYPVTYPAPGQAEQHPDVWWDAAVRSVREVLEKSGADPAGIAGVGVDGQSWAMAAVDRDGNALLPSPIWTDLRAADVCSELVKLAGKDRIFSVSGNPVMPGYTLPKVLWMKKEHPELYRETDKVLQSNGYIVFRLTGEATQDLSQGYGWHCFDPARGTWDRALAEDLGLRVSLLPDILPCSGIAGTVSAEAASLTGLAEGTPVVAGGLDAACGTLGVGVVNAGQTQEQGGQAGGMSICLDVCRSHPDLILSPHVVPDRWLLQGGTTGGGGALRWFREELCPGLSFEAMSDLAEKAEPGSGGVRFLPFMAGERSPLWDPDAKAVFYGLGFSASLPQMIRSVMEGTAFALRHNLETAESAGAVADVLRSMGGACRSSVWMQIKADVTGHVLEVPQADTATAWGAAILAGLGTGVWKDAEEAVRGIRILKTYEPDARRREIYENAYGEYRRLTAALGPIFHEKRRSR